MNKYWFIWQQHAAIKNATMRELHICTLRTHTLYNNEIKSRLDEALEEKMFWKITQTIKTIEIETKHF